MLGLIISITGMAIVFAILTLNSTLTRLVITLEGLRIIHSSIMHTLEERN